MQMAAMPGFFKSVLHAGRRSPHQHFRDGVCRAALRAFTAAEYRREHESTLVDASARHGSCVAYVAAADTLIEHGDQILINRVLRGGCSILAAAATVEGLVKLVNAFETATPETRAKFFAATGTADLSTTAKRTEAASKLGPETVWEEMIVPL